MMMEELGFSPEEVQAGGTVVYAAVDGSYAGCILLEDTVKPGAREALAELRALGVRETVMLTGDREHAAASVAPAVGSHPLALPGSCLRIRWKRSGNFRSPRIP